MGSSLTGESREGEALPRYVCADCLLEAFDNTVGSGRKPIAFPVYPMQITSGEDSMQDSDCQCSEKQDSGEKSYRKFGEESHDGPWIEPALVSAVMAEAIGLDCWSFKNYRGEEVCVMRAPTPDYEPCEIFGHWCWRRKVAPTATVRAGGIVVNVYGGRVEITTEDLT